MIYFQFEICYVFKAGENMDNPTLNAFIRSYAKDKEEFYKKFENLDKKLNDINKRFDSFEKGIASINKKLSDVEDIQYFLFSKAGGIGSRLDNIKVYLSSIRTSLNEYKTLVFQGHKEVDGEIMMLKFKLQRIKPIINWENNKTLFSQYKEIENDFVELEKVLQLDDGVSAV